MHIFFKIGVNAHNFMGKWLQRKCFPVNIEKCFRTPILKSICEWLLLEMPLWWSEKACNFIASSAQVFSCEHCEIFQDTYFKEHLGTTPPKNISGIWPRRSATLLKRDSNTLVFHEYCEVSFYRTPPLAASENIMVS